MRPVVSYRSYREARHAVGLLANRKFPVDRVAIVAGDLDFLKQGTVRLRYSEAAMQGAISGALTGFLVVVILGWLGLITPLISGPILALYGVLIGAIVGAVAGFIRQVAFGDPRDFAWAQRIDAGRYDVMVEESFAREAGRLLSRLRIAEPA